uniref:Uncharacterized protein n=1 Tax=Aegilops tauschii subsp. strangulata TaxID=200361 RepID=A0A453IZL8_AEGTS
RSPNHGPRPTPIASSSKARHRIPSPPLLPCPPPLPASSSAIAHRLAGDPPVHRPPAREFVQGDVVKARERVGRRGARSRGRRASVASIRRPSRLPPPVRRGLRRRRLRWRRRWIR